jgi:hypothetical protein
LKITLREKSMTGYPMSWWGAALTNITMIVVARRSCGIRPTAELLKKAKRPPKATPIGRNSQLMWMDVVTARTLWHRAHRDRATSGDLNHSNFSVETGGRPELLGDVKKKHFALNRGISND